MAKRADDTGDKTALDSPKATSEKFFETFRRPLFSEKLCTGKSPTWRPRGTLVLVRLLTDGPVHGQIPYWRAYMTAYFNTAPGRKKVGIS